MALGYMHIFLASSNFIICHPVVYYSNVGCMSDRVNEKDSPAIAAPLHEGHHRRGSSCTSSASQFSFLVWFLILLRQPIQQVQD
jgi:hypothetical protein